mmetsp:Transcript_1696/g.5194  ORF Transcript_1696/g.5194 Transcript_1696/m.5194 type:complete len:202 (-) Transcript_1696:1282-1887(-)
MGGRSASPNGPPSREICTEAWAVMISSSNMSGCFCCFFIPPTATTLFPAWSPAEDDDVGEGDSPSTKISHSNLTTFGTMFMIVSTSALLFSSNSANFSKTVDLSSFAISLNSANDLAFLRIFAHSFSVKCGSCNNPAAPPSSLFAIDPTLPDEGAEALDFFNVIGTACVNSCEYSNTTCVGFTAVKPALGFPLVCNNICKI